MVQAMALDVTQDAGRHAECGAKLWIGCIADDVS
jgi:hypothetical protein